MTTTITEHPSRRPAGGRLRAIRRALDRVPLKLTFDRTPRMGMRTSRAAPSGGPAARRRQNSDPTAEATDYARTLEVLHAPAFRYRCRSNEKLSRESWTLHGHGRSLSRTPIVQA